MSSQLQPIILVPGLTATTTVPQGIYSMKVSNTSPYDLDISGFGIVGDEVIPSGLEYMLYSYTYQSGSIKTTFQNNKGISPANPGAILIVIYFTKGEMPVGTWPVTIPTSVVQGSSTVTVAQSIQNNGNSPTTPIITAQPSDVTGVNPTVLMDNSGNTSISSDNEGVLTTLLQLIAGASPAVKLAAASVLTEALGNMKVDGTFESVGSAIFDGSITLPNNTPLNIKDSLGTAKNILEVDTSNNVNIQTSENGGVVQIVDAGGNIIAAFVDSNTNQTQVDGANASATFGRVFFSIGGFKAINSGSALSGTINHGLSGTPTAVLCVCNSSGSSATVGAYSYTSSQFGMTIGASLNGRWVAYR